MYMNSGYPPRGGYGGSQPVQAGDAWQGLSQLMQQAQMMDITNAKPHLLDVQSNSGNKPTSPWCLTPRLNTLSFSDGGPAGPRLELKGVLSYLARTDLGSSNSYDAPIRIVLPYNFPTRPPYVFVDPPLEPTMGPSGPQKMVVNPAYLARPPPHFPRVDPSYQNLLHLEYLREWKREESGLTMLLVAMQSTFSLETPVQTVMATPGAAVGGAGGGGGVASPSPFQPLQPSWGGQQQQQQHQQQQHQQPQRQYQHHQPSGSTQPSSSSSSSTTSVPLYQPPFDPKAAAIKTLTERLKSMLRTRYEEVGRHIDEARGREVEAGGVLEAYEVRAGELQGYARSLEAATEQAEGVAGVAEGVLKQAAEAAAAAAAAATAASPPSACDALSLLGGQGGGEEEVLRLEVEASVHGDYVKLLRELHAGKKLTTGQCIQDVRKASKAFWLAHSRAMRENERMDSSTAHTRPSGQF